MILAGIDEAGLGPALGPLCQASVCLRVPDGWGPDTPWQALSKVLTGAKKRGDSRLLVADSKVVHASRKTRGLERGVLAFIGAGEGGKGGEAIPVGKESLLLNLGAEKATGDLKKYPWYAETEWEIPAFGGQEALEDDIAALCSACQAEGVVVADITAEVTLAGMLNDLLAEGKNKSEAVLDRLGSLLRNIVLTFPDEDVTLTVDRQGGRQRYGPFLSEVFGGAWIVPKEENAGVSTYEISHPTGRLLTTFVPRADKSSFAVALASMVAKYLRERFMADLNAFFAERIPGLAPTAGYHGDAPRFLDEIEPVWAELYLPRSLLLRER